MRLRIYSCGGAATNITSKQSQSTVTKGFTDLNTVYVDTAKSNISSNVNPENCYILEGKDGSGKLRTENHKEIDDNINKLLLKHPPAIFNLVIFSGGGGSGSVFGPLLIRELLDRKHGTVAIVLMSDESAIAAKNSLNTLKSLEGVCNLVKMPVVVDFVHNKQASTRTEVDEIILSDIACLSALISEENHDLDSMDLLNWLNFTKVTSEKACVSVLDICHGDLDQEDVPRIVSMASLMRRMGTAPPEVLPEYSCTGYRNVEDDKMDADMHFIIHTEGLDGIADKVKASNARYDELISSKAKHRSELVDEDDNVTSNGLVL